MLHPGALVIRCNGATGHRLDVWLLLLGICQQADQILNLIACCSCISQLLQNTQVIIAPEPVVNDVSAFSCCIRVERFLQSTQRIIVPELATEDVATLSCQYSLQRGSTQQGRTAVTKMMLMANDIPYHMICWRCGSPEVVFATAA